MQTINRSADLMLIQHQINLLVLMFWKNSLKRLYQLLETDYKSLTTNDSNQRESYRSHIINAVENINSSKNQQCCRRIDEVENDLEEEIEINVGDDTDDDKFIDIRTDAEKSADDEEEEEDPRDSFGTDVEGDETGRNVAYQSLLKK
jgi:hypothetical protein